MARKRYKPEEIVSLLRQAEVLHGQGKSMADAAWEPREESGSGEGWTQDGSGTTAGA